MKIKVPCNWLFPEDLAPAGNLFEFVETKDYEKNGRVEGQVFILLGETTKAQGEFQIFPSKISNLKELVKKFGDDSAKWACIKFKATAQDKKILFTPI